MRDDDGKVWLLNAEEGRSRPATSPPGSTSPSCYCTLSLLIGPDRAVAAGQRVLGPLRLAKAWGSCSSVALSSTTRRAIRKRRDLLVHLRDLLLECPQTNPEQVELERLRRELCSPVVHEFSINVIFRSVSAGGTSTSHGILGPGRFDRARARALVLALI